MMDRIAMVNKLYDAGHEIKYMTASRGAVSKVDYYELIPKTQLRVGEQNTQNLV